jgi:hypothetical protein
MALIKCTECQAEISDQADKCPHCGFKAKKPGVSVWVWVALGIFGFFVIGVWVSPPASSNEKWQARRAIENCWDDQKKKSLDPGTQRLIAGACEKMERDFTQKYGTSP